MNCVGKIRSRITPNCTVLAGILLLTITGKTALAQSVLGFGLGPSPTSPGMDQDQEASVFAGLRNTDDDTGLNASAFSQPQADPDFVTVGFSYLRPDWSHDAFQVLVPGTSAADVGLGSELRTRRLDYSPELNFAFDAQSIFGTDFKLTGRRIKSTGTLTEDFLGMQLKADSSVDMVMAGIGPKPFRTTGEFDSISLGFETRYIEITQHYNSSLAAGMNSQTALLTADSKYHGVGFAVYSDYTYQILSLEEWYTGLDFIGGFDATISLGRNDRDSSLVVNSPNAATAVMSTVGSDGTDFVFGGEIYAGFRLTFDRDLSLIANPTASDRKKWTLDAVAYGSCWSNIGLLNPRDPGLDNNDLYTYGFMIYGGVFIL